MSEKNARPTRGSGRLPGPDRDDRRSEIAVGLLAGSAASATSATPTIVIGPKLPEEYILGELYKQALEAKGFNVSYKENIGSTEIVQTALTSGKINFYPSTWA